MKSIIDIAGTSYPIKFGYGAFRSLGKKWGCNGTTEVLQKLSVLDKIPETGLTFDQEQLVLDIVEAGIACGSDYKLKAPSQDVMASSVLFDSTALEMIFGELMESFPRVGKQNPEKTGAKK